MEIGFEHLVALIGLGHHQLPSSVLFQDRAVPAVEQIIESRFLELPGEGLSLALSHDDRVTHVQIYGVEDGPYRRYAGSLPSDLAWSMSREQVRFTWGEPIEMGEAQLVPILGLQPPWDAFEKGGVRVHVSYKLEGPGISMITLSRS